LLEVPVVEKRKRKLESVNTNIQEVLVGENSDIADLKARAYGQPFILQQNAVMAFLK